MAEPEDILAFLQNASSERSFPLLGKKALVTAGPTFEPIDPVRFIGNHSSGKMGYAIAETLQSLGAEVTLISGPCAIPIPEKVAFISVSTANEMLESCLQQFPSADITVMSAAVADYRPKEISLEKIKKKTDTITIELEKTTDILAILGAQKSTQQILVGFALETHNEVENAKDKLVRKNLDFIVLNSLQDEGAGFAGDQNKISILTKHGEEIIFDLKSKQEVALDICQKIIELTS